VPIGAINLYRSSSRIYDPYRLGAEFQPECSFSCRLRSGIPLRHHFDCEVWRTIAIAPYGRTYSITSNKSYIRSQYRIGITLEFESRFGRTQNTKIICFDMVSERQCEVHCYSAMFVAWRRHREEFSFYEFVTE